ncbi:MAG: PEP-CTERM sorting domain-containing protein [Rhodocyclales bacterium]|nr:PEP-CTERM sorting domain-containing protein [Rhodocyclales bacterium]
MNRFKLNAIAAVIALAACQTAQATTITFDEFAATNNNSPLTTLYAGLGVTFGTDNSGTFGGIGQGDPGNWSLFGTNGTAFLGNNGVNNFNSYDTTIFFSSAVSNVSFDVSRSNGSTAGQSMTAYAYQGATLLGSQSVNLGAINSWSTFSFAMGGIDKLVLDGSQGGFSPYGVDNLQFNSAAPVPEPETYAMMLAGLGLLGVVARRRRQRLQG